MRFALVTVLAATVLAVPGTAVAAKPTGWPRHVAIGLADQPGGAAELRGKAELRYQYLTGGVNTGSGWATWNEDGSFVTRYLAESRTAGVRPVFTYYQLLQSRPAAGADEAAKDFSNLRNAATMRAYRADLALLFRRLRGAGRVVVQVEPDLWGYFHQKNEVGLARSFARTVRALRDKHAPNVALGWHLSVWGTKEDPTYTDPSVAHMTALGRRSAAFYARIGRPFDLVFADVADRDSGFARVQEGDPGTAWTDVDFRNYAAYFRAFTRAAKRPLALWQIPLGNSALPDTRTRFKDNRVETWLAADGARLRDLRDAGVVALLFGGGAEGTTSETTDGGLFDRLARAYYARGALPLP